MKKRFDCVAMKRAAQEEIQKHLTGKSAEEQFAYWETRNAEFRKWQSTLEPPQARAQETAGKRQ
jgi:hypothetical protein